MKKVFELESALRTNKLAIKKVTNVQTVTAQNEYRSLLLQRSALKDKLIDAYREHYLGEIKLTNNKESV